MELLRRVSCLTLAVIIGFVVTSTNAQPQDCPPILTSDVLGSTTVRSTDGLISSSLIVGGGDNVDPPEIRILSVNQVCDLAGRTRDTSRGVSLVVEYECDSQLASLPNCRFSTTNTPITTQFQFTCLSGAQGPEWTAQVLGTASHVVTEPAHANLNTPLDNRCSICIDFEQDSDAVSDNVTHCFPCDPACNVGLMRCYGEGGDRCCNFYNNDVCVAACPNNLVPNAEFVCVPNCDRDALVTFTSNPATVSAPTTFQGSVATYSCPNGVLMGDMTRTCQGDGTWSGSEPLCHCDTNDLGVEPNTQPSVVWTSTLAGGVATYTCQGNDLLLQGEPTRMCQADSTWDGSKPSCGPCSSKIENCKECMLINNVYVCTLCDDGFKPDNTDPDQSKCVADSSPEENRSACNTACIIGIIVAIIAAVVLATVVAIAIFALYKYLNNPATKLAKTDTEGLNGVARDNPLYVDPSTALDDAA